MNKKTLLTLLQIAITAGILAWLFRDGETDRKILQALSHADLGWLATAFGCFAVVEVAGITRWQILLRVQGIHIGWWRLAALFLIGVLFNPFLPGGTGGDVAKIFYLLKETPERKPAAMLAVLMDRLIGLFGVIVIAGLVIALRYQWLTQTSATATLLYTLLAIFAGSLGFIVVSFAVTGLGLVHKLPSKMPMRNVLVDLSVAYAQYARAWKASLLGLLLCVPVQLSAFTLSYCVGRAFTESASRGTLMDYWGIMPIVGTIAAIPVSIGGTGVREGLFVQLLGDLCGIARESALTISLTNYAVLIAWSLVGGVVYLLYRPSGHARVADMNQEVSEVEHEIAETEEAAENPTPIREHP
ncbi:MAG: lysylphosphatidylglycerol synthase transmembrane domain-containing protein [Chthoniobacteraceae bacterium]